MLGFDYTGQTYLASFPLGKFIVDVVERLNVNDNIKTFAYHVLSNLEEIDVEDDVNTIVGQFLEIIEAMNISDNIEMGFIIVALEAVIIYQKNIYPLVTFFLNEVSYIQDAFEHLNILLVQEIISLFGLLKIDGKEVLELWRKCYEKSIAVVENMYQKFRR